MEKCCTKIPYHFKLPKRQESKRKNKRGDQRKMFIGFSSVKWLVSFVINASNCVKYIYLHPKHQTQSPHWIGLLFENWCQVEFKTNTCLYQICIQLTGLSCIVTWILIRWRVAFLRPSFSSQSRFSDDTRLFYFYFGNPLNSSSLSPIRSVLDQPLAWF